MTEPDRDQTEPTLQELLNTLDDVDLAYVTARSTGKSDAQAYEAVGISKSAWFRRSEEDRDRLNDIAAKIRRGRTVMAMRALDEAAEKAALVLVGQLDDKDGRIKQKAAIEVLDRTVGKPVQNMDMTSNGQTMNPAPQTFLPEVKPEPESYVE